MTDKCRGCFGAANNDCDECQTKGENKNMNENICCCVDGCTWNDKNGHCTHYGVVISDAETGEPVCTSAEFDEE